MSVHHIPHPLPPNPHLLLSTHRYRYRYRHRHCHHHCPQLIRHHINCQQRQLHLCNHKMPKNISYLRFLSLSFCFSVIYHTISPSLLTTLNLNRRFILSRTHDIFLQFFSCKKNYRNVKFDLLYLGATFRTHSPRLFSSPYLRAECTSKNLPSCNLLPSTLNSALLVTSAV